MVAVTVVSNETRTFSDVSRDMDSTLLNDIDLTLNKY